MAGERVLIIDSAQQDARSLIEQVLQPEGYQVALALDGAQGLRQALGWQPDVMIIDHGTQQRSGLDIQTQVRQTGRDVSVVLVGTSDSADVLRRALRMGVVDYLVKPVEAEEVRDAVRRALARKTRPVPTAQVVKPAEEGKQLNRELAQRVRELNILHGLGKVVTSTRSLEKLLTRIVEAAVYLTKAEEGFLLLLDEETNELYLRAGQGLGKKLATGFRVKSTDSVVWQVIRTGEPTLITSEVDEEKLKIKTGYLVRALLHVPLKLGDQVIGVLSVDNKIARRSFTDNDLHLLSALVELAAIAIDNVRQFERAEAEATKLAEMVAERSLDETAEEVGEAEEPPVPLEWLMHELEVQRGMAEEGQREAERLAKDLAGHVSAVEKLAAGWRSQQAEADELTRRLATAKGVAAPGGPAPVVDALTDLQATLERLGAGFLVVDPQGIVTRASAVTAQLLASDRLVGRDLRQIVPSAQWLSSVERLLSHAGEADAPWQEITFWSKGRLIKGTFMPVPGRDRGWLVVLRDLFRERAVQFVFEDLSAALSEGLRTPMTILSTYTELLLAETVGLLVPAQQRLLERMRESLSQMARVLNKPSVSAPWAAEPVGDTSWATDLDQVLERALADAASWLSDKQLQVRTDLKGRLPKVAAQADCVYQMLSNLLQNAAQATPVGGTITIRAQASDGVGQDGEPAYVAVSLEDQGGGIPPEFLGHVFERFFSEDERPIPGLGGKGAELSAAKTLVEAFGGRVWVESEAGVGSTFSFVLPAIPQQRLSA